jgi:gas vesicle protein
MSRDGGSSGTVLAAFVIGALAGAVAALLYAPAAGEETRKKIAEKARQGRGKAEGAVRAGREFVDQHRDTIAGAIERGREAYEQVRKETL